MKKKLFIGIDFSKKTFDVSLIEEKDPSNVLGYRQFANTREGCGELLVWVRSHKSYAAEDRLFCGEHTGLYSVLLSEFLIRKGLFLWLENPLQVKMSSGIKRDKSDRTDSLTLALYACRNRDRAKLYQLPDKALRSLGLLLSFRERLLGNKHSLLVSSKEIRSVLQRDATVRLIYEQSGKQIDRIDKDIKQIEKQMSELINTNEALRVNSEVISSIKGIALINTAAILVATGNFTRFETSRQFACFSGMAPFGRQSGSSIRTKPHVSRLANIKLKVLLTQAARCAVRYDLGLKTYYERKRAEGKDDSLVINNVRNKLIHRIFALVANGQLYQADYHNALQKTTA
ncbi:MAG: IS110 family transposase [Mediterranea sp.]|jgi:transposase|nr:IS110 family transposase [Mediterranea sp.]